ncbi:MAG: hypothetical protein ACFFDN_22950 [Candidatus Hodarchaeota archaeon]
MLSKTDNHWFEKLLKFRFDKNGKSLEELISDEIHSYNKTKMKLNEGGFPDEALTFISRIILTRSYWRPKYWERLGLTIVTYENLKNGTIERLVQSKLKNGSLKNTFLNSLQAFIKQLEGYNSLKEWSDERHYYTIIGKEDPYIKELKGVGMKGRDNMLRDLGYFDRAPIDRHEVRFLVRTGIFHKYAPKNADITGTVVEWYEGIHNTLSEFARQELIGVETENISLANAPGIVDMVIWRFCCSKEDINCMGVCGSNPKCSICPIRNHCQIL